MRGTPGSSSWATSPRCSFPPMCKLAAATLWRTDTCWDVLIKHSTTLQGFQSKSVTIHLSSVIGSASSSSPPRRLVWSPSSSQEEQDGSWSLFWMWLPDHSVSHSGFPVIFPGLVYSFCFMLFRRTRVEWRKLILPSKSITIIMPSFFMLATNYTYWISIPFFVQDCIPFLSPQIYFFSVMKKKLCFALRSHIHIYAISQVIPCIMYFWGVTDEIRIFHKCARR